MTNIKKFNSSNSISLSSSIIVLSVLLFLNKYLLFSCDIYVSLSLFLSLHIASDCIDPMKFLSCSVIYNNGGVANLQEYRNNPSWNNLSWNIPRWNIPWFFPNLFLLGNDTTIGYFQHSYVYIYIYIYIYIDIFLSCYSVILFS